MGVPVYSPADIELIVGRHKSGATTRELQEHFGCTRDSMNGLLKRLAKQGLIVRHKHGRAPGVKAILRRANGQKRESKPPEPADWSVFELPTERISAEGLYPLQLSRCGCEWPFNHPDSDRRVVFCDAEIDGAGRAPYCAKHMKMAFRQPQAVEEE